MEARLRLRHNALQPKSKSTGPEVFTNNVITDQKRPLSDAPTDLASWRCWQLAFHSEWARELTGANNCGHGMLDLVYSATTTSGSAAGSLPRDRDHFSRPPITRIGRHRIGLNGRGLTLGLVERLLILDHPRSRPLGRSGRSRRQCRTTERRRHCARGRGAWRRGCAGRSC
jgi:hypothetical protein